MEKSFSKIKMYLSDKNFWTTLSIEVLGVIVFFVPHPLAYLVGIIIIICGAVYAYFKGHTIDEKLNKTGKTLEEQKKELAEMSHEARKILNELRDAKEEINKMKKDVFDVFSKRGFKNVEQRLKDLENFVGLEAYGSYHGSNNLQKKVENLERKIDELKRNWRF